MGKFEELYESIIESQTKLNKDEILKYANKVKRNCLEIEHGEKVIDYECLTRAVMDKFELWDANNKHGSTIEQEVYGIVMKINL